MPGSSPEDTNSDAEIKPEGQVEASATEVSDVQESPAASSTAEAKGEPGKGDLLSAVKEALKPKPEQTPDSEKPGSKPEAEAGSAAVKEGGEAADDSDDLTEEELNRLRPKTRKRIENLLKDRTDRDTTIADLKPKAEQFERITGFVEQAGLTKDDVNQGFGVMADLKQGRADKAYAVLKPIVDQLAIIVGDVLPDDLKQEVAFGRITEAHARELAKARGSSRIATDQLDRSRQQADQQRQQAAQQQVVGDVSGAVSDWERSKEKTDPSWKLKQPRVQEIVEIELLRRQRQNPSYFPTKDEALKLSKDALEKVEKEFKVFAPKPKAINAPGDVGSTRSTAQPKTMLEAARAGLDAARAG